MNQIDSIGYDAVHQSNFRYDIPEGFHNYIIVVTTTPALFDIDGEVAVYPAHSAILYPPGRKIWYGASEETYGNHWMQFSCEESFVTHFPLQGIPFTISDPEYIRRLFQLLTWEQSPDLIAQLIRVLFNKLHDELSTGQVSAHDHELLALRRQISTNPGDDWNVARMAEELHMSSGYLQSLYKQQFDISCMEDVIAFRIQKAKDYLTYTTLSISEIAELCGYRNTEHFCRQFRANAGFSPGTYRKKPDRIS